MRDMSDCDSGAFSGAGQKRNYSSSTEESDCSLIRESSDKQERKRPNTAREDQQENMSVQEVLEKVNKRLDFLATKEDVRTIQEELKTLTDTFMHKVKELEGRVFEMEAKTDKTESQVAAVKKNEGLQNMIRQQDRVIKQNEKDINDLQQYSRRWNVRVYRVPEVQGETADDCVKKVCQIFTKDVGVATSPTDIEVAHRAGKYSDQQARPILVRFFDRKKRDAVIGGRRKLKNKGTVIGEDLTYANYRLSTAAFKHSATLSVWSTNGKVLAKLKNGQTIRLNIHMDLDDAFRRAMSSNSMSDDEENR